MVKVEKFNSVNFIVINIKEIEVVLCDLGASIYSIKFDNKLMTLTPSKKDDFMKENIYHGKTIGRVANRLPGNKVIIGDREYELANNEGPNTLHGGTGALSAQKFEYKVIENKDNINVIFTYLDKEKKQGFAGDLNVIVEYLITHNSVTITFKCSTNKLTMCSLTNHAYFTLGTQSLDELELQIKASKFLHPNPSDLLPLEIRNVDKIMDFSQPHKITDYIDNSYLMNSKTKGYDHYYYFDEINTKHANILLKNNKYQMKIFTDYSGTQIYTDNYVIKEEFSQSGNKTRRGIAIEPSESQKELHYLNKDQNYQKFIRYEFIKIK